MTVFIRVFNMHRDIMPFILRTQLISCNGISMIDRFTVTQPLIQHACSRDTVWIINYRTQHSARLNILRVHDGDTTWLIIIYLGNRLRFRAGRRFRMLRVVLISRLDADFLANIISRQRVALACRASDFLAIAQPLVGNARIRHAILILHFRRQRLTHFGVATDGDCAFVVTARWGCVAGNGIRLAALRCFRMLRVVGVFGFDADFVSFVFGGQRVGLAVRACYRVAIALPLVADFGFVKLVGVVHLRGQGFAYFGVAADGDVAFVVRLRLWRVDRRVVRVVLYVQGEGFVVAATVAVVAGDLQGDGFFGRVVEVFAIFQLQRAVGGYFKAVVAYFVGVFVACVRVGRRQFADCRAVFAFRDFVIVEGDVGRRLVG